MVEFLIYVITFLMAGGLAMLAMLGVFLCTLLVVRIGVYLYRWVNPFHDSRKTS